MYKAQHNSHNSKLIKSNNKRASAINANVVRSHTTHRQKSKKQSNHRTTEPRTEQTSKWQMAVDSYNKRANQHSHFAYRIHSIHYGL